MKPLQRIRTLFNKKRPERRLIVESNGFLLKGVIAESRDGQVNILDFAQSTKASPDLALEDVINDLKSRHPKFPIEATLISSQSAASILELPLNPQAPFRREEVQELVRWEFEQQLAEQTASLTLDTVLVGRNLLSESDIDDAR